MKLIVAPMAALAETRGPFGRARAVALAARERGHSVALCAAQDPNFEHVGDIVNYPAPIPVPFGLPLWLGRQLLPLAQRLGVAAHKPVHSFEQVLHLVGALQRRYFAEDVRLVRSAIRADRADVLFSEFRLSAIVAARLEGIAVASGISVPARASYRSNPEYSDHVRRYLAEHDLPPVQSALEIFDWAEIKFVASSPDLEPIDVPGVHHVGPYTSFAPPQPDGKSKRAVVAYLGSGAVSPSRTVKELSDAFRGSRFRAYVASAQGPELDEEHIEVRPRFAFERLLPGAAAFVNHGGQNSVMAGLAYGVPQLVFPGRVFEREYNADSVVRLGAGLRLDTDRFRAEALKQAVDSVCNDTAMRDRAREAGRTLQLLGGATKVVQILEQWMAEKG